MNDRQNQFSLTARASKSNFLSVTKLWHRLLNFVVLLGCIAMSLISNTKAETLKISGVITEITYYSSKSYVSSNWFVVTIDRNQARIETGPMGERTVSYFEYGFLGKDSYLLAKYIPNLTVEEKLELQGTNFVRIKLPKPVKPENDAEIFVNSGRVPEYRIGLISPVWMAYCFGFSAVDSKVNHIQMLPVFPMGNKFRDGGGLADITFTLDSDFPHCARTLTETVDSQQFTRLKIPTTFDGTFTNGIYEVLNWTNVGNFSVPQQFQATNQWEQPGSKWVAVYQGIATNIMLESTSIPPFKMPNVTAVVERRSEVVTPTLIYSYTTTNGTILSRETLLQQHPDFLKSDQSDLIIAPQSNKPKTRAFIYFCFGFLAIFPIILLIKKTFMK